MVNRPIPEIDPVEDDRSWWQRIWDEFRGASPKVRAKVIIYHEDIPQPVEIELSPLVIRDIAGRTHEMPTLLRKAAAKRLKKAAVKATKRKR